MSKDFEHALLKHKLLNDLVQKIQ